MIEKYQESDLARQMATLPTYDEAWMIGLEIQTMGPGSVHELRYVLEHGTTEARQAAAFWLSDEAEVVPAELLFKMANDDDSEVRFHAAYCLSYVCDKRTVTTLRQMMRQDVAEDVRQTAAQSLYAAAKINDSLGDILTDYETALGSDQSPLVREEVVTNLANFLKTPYMPRAIGLLENALKDTNNAVREQAKISLSVLKNESWNHEQKLH